MTETFLKELAVEVAANVVKALEGGERSAIVPPRLMGVHGAAAYLGRTSKAVRHLVTRGKLPVVRFEGEDRVFFDRADLDQLIDQSKGQWG